MTNPVAQDALGLAEAVAAGELSLQDAESRIAAQAGSRPSAGDLRDLHRSIAAIEAVRAHASATFAAGAAGQVIGGRAPALLGGGRHDVTGREGVRADRPGVVTTVLPGPVRRGSRPTHDGRALAVAASLVVVAGALGFAFAGGRASTPSPRPSDNGLATVTGPSVPPAAAAFRASDHPEVFADAAQFALTSATVGWLRTYDPGSRMTGLYRTTDAGQTWTQLSVTPVGPARFVDDTTAYVNAADGPILVTHDGGATWRPASFIVPAGAVGPWLVTAASPDVAYVTYAASETSSDLLVYSTTDGGTTWSGPAHGTTAVLDASFNKPQGGDNGLLWMTLGKADNRPFDNRVAISTNGGATWTIQSLPADATFPAASLKGPSAIGADGDGHETIGLSNGDSTGIYSSNDAGQTWTRVHLWSDQAIVELRSAHAWTATTATAFWSTIDGGQTWRQTPRGAEPPVVGVTFATPDVGWAEVVCGHRFYETTATPDPICGGRSMGVVLMATADGGATWVPIGR